MKNKGILLSMLAVMALASCTDKKSAETVTEEPAAVEVNDATATKTDSVTQVPQQDQETIAEGTEITVKGKIKEINQGKDGYTARIEMADGKAYMATISIPNLKDPKQYKKYNVGDEIKVKGKAYPIEEDTLIKVEELW